MTSQAPVTVQRVSTSDLDAILEIERTSFSDPWSASSFAAIVAEPAAFFGVARDDAEDGVAGYVVAWFAADEGEIANLAVSQPTRRRGVGAALLDAALDEAGRRGAIAVYLEVRESNSAARALYTTRQFEEVGRRRKYYRTPVEDAVILRRMMPARRSGAER
jgi:ribosomal-protein-alanine N-acetyltransferase